MQGSELHVSVSQTPNIQHSAIINNTCLNYVQLENVGHFMLCIMVSLATVQVDQQLF